MRNSHSSLYIGLMSGTSLDGIDGVLADFSAASPRTVAAASVQFESGLRAELMALQAAGHDEIHREALAANGLARHYAECVASLLRQASVTPDRVRAIGAHGQTVRHRPDSGYTRQVNNPALLAELCGIDIVSDFRSRDVAAGGQGAPLVPAFHHGMFGAPGTTRVVANIGGIANISVLRPDGVTGFDTGPGNVLMDGWISRHLGKPYDNGGAWAASGKVVPGLLDSLLAEPFLALAPPKSTGRDLFHGAWLDARLAPFADAQAADVQATLAAFTAAALADAVARHAADADSLYICGGGAYNDCLMEGIGAALQQRKLRVEVWTTDVLGIPPNRVEALAFAWLAHRFCERLPGNLPAVTGAGGLRILGSLTPA